MLMNPLTESSSNRTGIAYVVSRMEWYWRLSDLLLDKNGSVDGSYSLQGQLEKNVVELYATLIGYQIKSGMYYHRRRGVVFARDLVKWDDWEGELAAIQELEQLIRQDAAQFNTHEIQAQLEDIAKIAKAQNQSLHSIVTSIQDQTARQIEMQKTSEDNQCLRELYVTNPRDGKVRLEREKGGLLRDSYRWILDDVLYQRWCEDADTRLL
jgi:hypothetical protein